MPVWADITFFDLCARKLLRGGVLYRDIFLHNVPGRVLMGTAVRALFGWRSETIRAVDFGIVSAVIWLLVAKVQSTSWPPAARWWTAAVLYFFYFSTSEWCHCQPDGWMLLPALGALWLRQKQADALARAASRLPELLLRGLVEGLCWGAAFIIKPFNAGPALVCWFLSAALTWRVRRQQVLRDLILDAASVLAGCLTVGLLLVVWLQLSGAWPSFLDATLGTWNEEYFRLAGTLREHSRQVFVRLWPWSLVHVVALPAAALAIFRAFRKGPSKEPTAEALLSAFYIAWWIQANYLQRQYDYHLAPSVFLALAFLAGQAQRVAPKFALAFALPALALWAAIYHPLFDGRLVLWAQCCREGSTPAMRDALTLVRDSAAPRWIDERAPSHLRNQRLRDREVADYDPPTLSVAPRWVDLERVASYLRQQGVRDRELTCYDLSTLPLYLELNVEPSTRFVMLYAIVTMFNTHWAELAEEVKASPQRFIVTDLQALPGVTAEKAAQVRPGQPLALPPDMPSHFGASPLGNLYPWSEPVVFRAGRYFVHRFRPEEELRLKRPLQPASVAP
jgi:hypothetical protein